MSVLGLVGITGLYLRQVREAGILGLIGYMLFAAFYTVAVGFQFFEAFILPSVATEAPRLAESFLGIVSGAGGPIALPALEAVWLAVSVAYLGGGLLLGIAFFRAAVLPHAAERYAAIPVGLALVWLGAALWNEQRQTVTSPTPDHRGTPLGVSAAERHHSTMPHWQHDSPAESGQLIGSVIKVLALQVLAPHPREACLPTTQNERGK